MTKTAIKKYMNRILQEIEETPEEYLPHILQIVQAFKNATALKSAENSFRQGWKEVKAGKTYPVSELWNGIDG